jgi:hypothetical protein
MDDVCVQIYMVSFEQKICKILGSVCSSDSSEYLMHWRRLHCLCNG